MKSIHQCLRPWRPQCENLNTMALEFYHLSPVSRAWVDGTLGESGISIGTLDIGTEVMNC